jgi:undecaprenyl diphosphate synthase
MSSILKIKTDIEEIKLDKSAMPKHIAIIMDGNRRWAKEKKLPSSLGHSKGANTLTNIVKEALNLGIEVLTVFAFSTENWNRSQKEIDSLMKLFEMYLKKQAKFMQKKGVRLNAIGDISKFSNNLQNIFEDVKKKTSEGNKLDLVLAINYGSRDEIKRAILKIINDIDKNKIKKEEISEELISKYLDTFKYSDPDLIIRTSGAKRLSNFLLWQSAYSEIYITDAYWPDFSENHLKKAIHSYQRRDKRLSGA